MNERNWTPLPTVFQGAYNAVQRDAESDLLPLCRLHGMRYYAYSPVCVTGLSCLCHASECSMRLQLARGVLTGKFEAAVDPSKANPMQQRYLSASMTEAISSLRAACTAAGMELREAALRWLVYHSCLDPTHGDAVILGASSLEQIVDNVNGAGNGPLPRAVVDAFDDANAMLHPVAAYPFHQAMPL